MFKYYYIFLLWCTTLVGYNCPHVKLIKRNEPLHLKTSVIMPLHPLHFKFLNERLTAYSKQNIIPDEIVVSISEIARIPAEQLKSLENINWPFILKIIKNNEICSVGRNINIGIRNSIGDLIFIIGADDLQHPQTTEIAKYIFENYVVEFLMPRILPINNPAEHKEVIFDHYEMENMSAEYMQKNNFKQRENAHIGHAIYMRSVSNRVPWPEGFEAETDQIFLRRILANFDYNALIDQPLCFWRWHLSSHLEEGTNNWVAYRPNWRMSIPLRLGISKCCFCR